MRTGCRRPIADPERFAAEFSGSERTVAEYLLAEVLDHQPEPVRRLLPRTSVLDQVNGRLAELPALHDAAAWYAQHAAPVEAVRHAQAAEQWSVGLELARGRNQEELAAFQSAERLVGLLVTAHELAMRTRRCLLQTLVRLGETERVERAIAEMDAEERDTGELRLALAVLRLAQDEPEAATIALAPVLDGSAPVPNRSFGAPPPGEPQPLRESLSDSEKRILRYLPTHLSAPEIAGELNLSVHTVKSHMRHVYAKLGTHRRAETVEQARALGLLAPSSRQR
jgi:ATP/maltotriose-dependent transcriptional regulator MalT